MNHRIILDYDDETKGFTLSWTGGLEQKSVELFEKMVVAGKDLFSVRVVQNRMIGPSPSPPPGSVN